MSHLVSLGDAWSNKGFMGLRKRYGPLLRTAFAQVPPKVPCNVSVADCFRERVEDWESAGATPHAHVLSNLSALRPHPVRRLFTISDILFDRTNSGSHTVQLEEKDVVMRWQYHDVPFTIYWALTFHLTNKQLDHPDELCREILAFGEYVYPDIKKSGQARRAFLLALYERTLGMEADKASRRQHYVNLIENHETEGGPGRALLFADFVEFMKRFLERELTH